MINELLFGTAYYVEYMPMERLQKDIEMMKHAGMNVVRIAESTWSTLEPREGEFCFEHVDRVLDEIEKAGMKAIVGTPTYAIPSWMVKIDPKVIAVTKRGKPYYGRRQIMDIINPTYRNYAERAIRRLLERTADRDCVIGFQIDNETKHYGTIGENVQDLFKEYLKDKYKTTKELNKAFYLSYWSNSIAAWNDLPDMRGCINGGLAGEFEKFQRSLAAEFLQWQAAIVNEYKSKDQFITHNFDFSWKKFGAEIAQDGHSYGIQPDIDHSEAAQSVDIVGCDIYHMTQDELTGAEIAFCGDEIRSLKQDSYIVLETQAQGFKNWTPYPGQLRLQAYSHLASGAMGVMYWNWHSLHNGYETYWKGLLSHDLEANPTYEEACRIGNEMKETGKNRLRLQKNNKVAIVVDNHTLTSFEWFPIDVDCSYNDVVRYMYDSLYEMNVECDIVHLDYLDTAKYSMLVTPALYSIGEDYITKIKDFVRRGGVLISTFKSFVADENLSVYHDAQPHRMTDCFGMSYNRFTNPGRATLRGKEVKYFAELLEPVAAETVARYEHSYWKKYAGITRNKFEKGVAYYLGCFADKTVLKALFESALVDAKILYDSSLSWPVVVRSGINDLGKKVHFILHYSENPKAIGCPYAKVTDVLTGSTYKAGETITLSDWDVKILEEDE